MGQKGFAVNTKTISHHPATSTVITLLQGVVNA